MLLYQIPSDGPRPDLGKVESISDGYTPMRLDLHAEARIAFEQLGQLVEDRVTAFQQHGAIGFEVDPGGIRADGQFR